jgi:hypothetical protein
VLSSGSPSESERAQEEVRDIRELSRRLGANPEEKFVPQFVKAIEGTSTKGARESNPLLELLTGRPSDIRVHFEILPGRIPTREEPGGPGFGADFSTGVANELWRWYYTDLHLNNFSLRHDRDRQPFETLMEFRNTWDGFWQHPRTVVPSWNLIDAYFIAIPVAAANEDDMVIEFAPERARYI